MVMKTSLHPFVTGYAFCLYGLISGNTYAQSFALEAGDNNIAAAYRAPAMKALAPALIFDARLLYTRENNHQDLFADAGLMLLLTSPVNLSWAPASASLQPILSLPIYRYSHPVLNWHIAP